MAIGTHEDITLSPDSIEFRDRVENLIVERLRDLAISKVRAERRTNVTLEDFKACLRQTLDDVAKEVLQEPTR